MRAHDERVERRVDGIRTRRGDQLDVVRAPQRLDHDPAEHERHGFE
jgi:hypothetical protein